MTILFLLLHDLRLSVHVLALSSATSHTQLQISHLLVEADPYCPLLGHIAVQTQKLLLSHSFQLSIGIFTTKDTLLKLCKSEMLSVLHTYFWSPGFFNLGFVSLLFLFVGCGHATAWKGRYNCTSPPAANLKARK